MADPLKIIAWADANQFPVLERAMMSGLIDVIGIGSPDPDEGISLSKAMKIEQLKDLRSALHGTDHDIAWIAARDALDAAARSAIRTSTRPVATSTLPPDPVLELLAEPDDGLPAHLVPMMRQSPGFIAATGALDVFGRIECVHISMTSGQEQSSPWARLYDAMDIILHMLGEPDEVFAAHAGPRPLKADGLAGLAGHFSVAARFPNQATATIVVSDGGGSWDRRMLVLGDEGRLIVNDHAAEWTHVEGNKDESGSAGEEPAGAGDLVAQQLKRIVEDVMEPEPPGTRGRVLKLCESARISCLTGQAEGVITP